MKERWFNEGGTVLDENRLPVARVVGQEEDDSDAKLIAAAPALYDCTEKAADTFRDLAKALVLLGKPVLAEACQVAENACRSALAEARDQ